MGPLLVINGLITPISRVITPVTYLFSAIYRDEITPFLFDRRGPPCKFVKPFFGIFFVQSWGGKSEKFRGKNAKHFSLRCHTSKPQQKHE